MPNDSASGFLNHTESCLTHENLSLSGHTTSTETAIRVTMLMAGMVKDALPLTTST